MGIESDIIIQNKVINVVKKYIILLLVVLLALPLVSCSSNQTGNDSANNTTNNSSEDIIVVGTLAPLSGNLAEYGIKIKNGLVQAIDEVNANGGILGKQIKFVVYDTEADATKTAELFNRQIEVDNVKFLLGPVLTSECNAVSEIAEENKIPVITPTGTGVTITQGKDYVFRMCFTDNYQGSIMAKYAADVMKTKKVAIMYNNASDYSIGIANAFKEKAESLGVEITNYEAYGKDDKDFSALVTKIKAKNPEAIFLPDYYDMVSNIMSQFRKSDFNPTFLGSDGMEGAAVEFAKEVNGGVFASHFAIKDTSELAKHFVKGYKEKFNELPNSFAALAYDTVFVLKKAMEDCDNYKDKEKIMNALKNVKVDTVCSANVTFDENGDPLNKMASIQKYVDEDVEFVTKISAN